MIYTEQPTVGSMYSNAVLNAVDSATVMQVKYRNVGGLRFPNRPCYGLSTSSNMPS
jgi:hypothetical protein